MLSYDGDDAPAKYDVAAQPDFAPEPVEAVPPPQNESAGNEAPSLDAPNEAPVKEEPMFGNGQNGNTGSSWNNEHFNGNHAGQYNDAQMEQDLPPIGIKEDG